MTQAPTPQEKPSEIIKKRAITICGDGWVRMEKANSVLIDEILAFLDEQAEHSVPDLAKEQT